jgi:uncharacterized membrane protein/hemerythrin superfamily protein
MAAEDGRDVIDEVLKDHDEIKTLFAEVESGTGDEKREHFEALVRKLAVHETAEQEIVHPLLRQADNGNVRDERLSEEKEAERELTELQRMGPEDPSFEMRLKKLQADVLEHAAAEESDEHPRIRASVDAERLRKLAVAFRAAEAAAPTRPHPNSPTSAIGNVAVGPIVAVMDRARDGIRSVMRKLSDGPTGEDGAADTDDGMHRVECSVVVEAPLRATYNQWTQFEDFPRFMEGVESVIQLDDRTVHWVAEVAGVRKEWDSEITLQTPDEEINWLGFGDSDNRGRIVFERTGDGTKVTMMLDYEPQGALEQIGDKLGLVRRRAEGDMKRFKEFLESRGRETGGWRGDIGGDEGPDYESLPPS